MILWWDNHLSPKLARFIGTALGHECSAIRDLGFAAAADRTIFDAARARADVVITKDADFAELVLRLGPPPAVVLLTCGNTSTDYLFARLVALLPRALDLTRSGEPLVEIA